jgi:phosphoribosyl 1,2-cyclic phosphodiesterase
MRFASLGSGSEGNALLIECGPAHALRRILIDCGFGLREATRRLERLGVTPVQIDAIFVTHEHGDHIGGAARLAVAAGATLYMTAGTAVAGLGQRAPSLSLELLDAHQPLELCGVRIEPVAVPHDAREPVQFVIDDGQTRLGVLTDLGHGTAHVVRAMSRLDAMVLECNHDAALLEASDYPRMLKRRISGPYGHLENTAAAELLAAIDQSRLRTVVAAHLSRSNNHPDLARRALATAWAGASESDVRIADQDEGIAWMSA